MIKLSIWIYALAAAVASWASAEYGDRLGKIAGSHIIASFHGEEKMHGITEAFCQIQWRVYYITVPMLLVAVLLSIRRNTDARHAMVFSGVVTLFLVLLVSMAAFASAYPFMNFVVQYKPE
jgi:cytochrome bd-type quinol oxidase subunit 2